MHLSKNLILGSNSPRRKEILTLANLKFNIIVRPTTENFSNQLAINEVPEFLAKEKAVQFHDFDDNYIVLTADTVVILNDLILNKPANFQEAERMLQSLSGNTHAVITGVCIKIGQDYETFSDHSYVTFKSLSGKEISYYIENFSPFDKAGAYGIQDFIGMIGITKIEGSHYNVMGLPIHKVYEKLQKYIIF